MASSLLAVLILAGSAAAVQAATPKAGEWSGSFDGPNGVYFSVSGKKPSITGFTLGTVSCTLQVKKTIPVKDNGRFVFAGAGYTGPMRSSMKIEGKFTSTKAGWVKIPKIAGNKACGSGAPKIDITLGG